MDEKMRGYIEESIDYVLEADILPAVEWIKDEIPITSLGELMLGYALGSLSTFMNMIILFSKRKEMTETEEREVRSMIRRRVPEIMEKINRELNR